VPACMVWEGIIKPGSVSDKLGLTMDFYPSICSIAGSSLTHSIDAVNLMPGLSGNNKEEDNRMVYFMRREGGIYGGLCYYAARKGAY